MRRAICLSVLLGLFLHSPNVKAIDDYEDETFIGFDGIVNELNRETQTNGAISRSRQTQFIQGKDPFDSIWMHLGVGYSATTQNVSINNDERLYLGLKGVQAAFGIDLFSENWMAEGTARSFAESDETTARASLQEFELKMFYKSRLAKNLNLRGGAGLSARYLNLNHPSVGLVQYTTPSSVATVGADIYLNDHISLGAEISARSTMIAETSDRSSFDATLRIDTHF